MTNDNTAFGRKPNGKENRKKGKHVKWKHTEKDTVPYFASYYYQNRKPNTWASHNENNKILVAIGEK